MNVLRSLENRDSRGSRPPSLSTDTGNSGNGSLLLAINDVDITVKCIMYILHGV